MTRKANGLPLTLVNRYVMAAKKSAKSRAEKIAAEEARVVVNFSTHYATSPDDLVDLIFPWIGTPGVGGGGGGEPEPESSTVEEWQKAIVKEIHVALCKKSRKYAREVAALKHNGKLLIAAIAGYIAASIGTS